MDVYNTMLLRINAMNFARSCKFICHYIYPNIVWVYKNIIDNQIQSTFRTGSNNFYTMVFNFFPCRASRAYNAKWVKQLKYSSVSVAQLVCLS